jgi:outer membrane protein assembly factor BamB
VEPAELRISGADLGDFNGRNHDARWWLVATFVVWDEKAQLRAAAKMAVGASGATVTTIRSLLVLPILLAGSLLEGAEVAVPDFGVAEISASTDSLLVRSRSLLADGQWVEAIEALRRAMAEDQRLVRMPSSSAPAGFVTYLPMGRYGQVQLSRLKETHPAALQVYRRSVDGLAQREFELGRDELDESRLQAVVDRYFTSAFGDDALFWLGELALERGDLVSARHFWESIDPRLRMTVTHAGKPWGGYPFWPGLANWSGFSDPSALAPLLGGGNTGNWLVYPDTVLPLASIRTRLALLSMLEGAADRAKMERELLRQQGGDSLGSLAGRHGTWLELLATLQPTVTVPPRRSELAWPTYAGSATRGPVFRNALHLSDKPLWTIPLPRRTWLDAQGGVVTQRSGEDVRGLLSSHPIVQQGRVVLQLDATLPYLAAWRLADGRPLFDTREAEAERAGLTGSPTTQRFPDPVLRTTLTAHGPYVYGVAGREWNEEEEADGVRRNHLLGWDASAEGRLVFEHRLELPVWEGRWVFEGAPLSDGEALYVGLRRTDGVRSELYVACFGMLDGRRVWLRSIGSAAAADGLRPDVSQNLLTLAGDTLYYNTNEGAVAALRARDGVWRWLTTYPRRVSRSDRRNGNQVHADHDRDTNPCLWSDDQIFVAPSDCNRIFALDSLTGQLLWASAMDAAADAVHLLGTTQEHLIVSGDTLSWLDRRSGRVAARFPAYSPAAPGMARPQPWGQGRGLLAGEQVYWPSREAIWVFDQELGPNPADATTVRGDPRLVRRIELLSRGAVGGHLSYADGMLLIASPDQLFVFAAGGTSNHVAERRPGSSPETECGLPADHR